MHGNAIGFLMAYSALGYIDAVKELAASVGMQVPESRPPTPQEVARKERETDLYALMEKAMDFYRAELKKAPRAIEYFKSRGLTGEIAARFGLGYAPDDWQGRRLGSELAVRLLDAAEACGCHRFVAHIAAGNTAIRRISLPETRKAMGPFRTSKKASLRGFSFVELSSTAAVHRVVGS